MANLAQIITPQICARIFFSKKKVETPIVIVFCDKQDFVKKKTNLAQIITPQKAKLGPDNNTTTYMTEKGGGQKRLREKEKHRK